MGYSTKTTHTTYATTFINTKSERKIRVATMLNKVTKAHENGVRFQVNFCLRTSKAYGEHSDNFRGYVPLQGKRKASILKDNLHDVDSDLKNNLWTDITIFIRNFMICITSINNHFFYLILILILLCKYRKCLLF